MSIYDASFLFSLMFNNTLFLILWVNFFISDLEYCARRKPCKNGALCRNVRAGQYSCTCKKGYTGRNCERGKRCVGSVLWRKDHTAFGDVVLPLSRLCSDPGG